MDLTYENRVAVVTGAGRGIGRAIAEALSAEGVTIACVSRSADSCGAAADAIVEQGGQARAYAVDVGDAAAVDTTAKQIADELGKVDILVNNAGITRDGLLLRMSHEDWDDVLRTNLSSCFYWIKALVHPMTRARWGRIVNISSVSGVAGNAGQVNYAAAKAGMIGLTKSLAKEFASRSITANAVAPGFITTDMTSKLDESRAELVSKAIPLRRFGRPEEVARLVTYLCSEEAGYITGQVYTIDGGLVM